MAISVSRYIYGLKNGDKVDLASSLDVSASEKKQLKSLELGQITDSGYLQSLWAKPAYGVMTLRSSRLAVIRVLPPTNMSSVNAQYHCYAVLIKQSDWLGKLYADIEAVLFCKELWSWHHRAELSTVEIGESPTLFGPDDDTRMKSLSLLGYLEANSDNENFKIITSENFTDYQVFRWVNILLPRNEKERFSYFSRCLNGDLPVKIVSVAGGFKPSGGEDVLIWKPDGRKAKHTPYTDYIRTLWPEGKTPPISYLQSYVDFDVNKSESVDGSNLNSLRGSSARERILTYIAQNPVKGGGKKYPNLSMPLNKKIFLTLAALVLIAVAGYAGLWTKDQLMIYKYEQRGSEFLEKYPLTVVFESQMPLEPVLAENKHLTEQIREFIYRSKTDELNSLHKKLLRWQNQAVAAGDQQTRLADLFADFQVYPLEQLPTGYPEPSVIGKVDDLQEELMKIQENFVLPSPQTINQLQGKLRQIERFNDRVKEIIEKLERETEEVESSFDSLDEPEYYSQPLLEDYQNILDAISLQLENPDLANAIVSPRQEDSFAAVEISDSLTDMQAEAEAAIKAMNSYYVNATNFIETFNFQYQLAGSKPSDDLSSRLKQLELLLNSIEKFWPGNPEIDQLRDKYDEIVTLDKLNGYSEQLNSIAGEIEIVEGLDEEMIEKFQLNLDRLEEKTEEINSDNMFVEQSREDVFATIENLQVMLSEQLEKLRTAEPEPNDVELEAEQERAVDANLLSDVNEINQNK